jgi:hypothetical protein
VTGGRLINTPTVPGTGEGVAGIAGGGILTAAPGAPGPPNPNGRKGGPEHQGTIADVIAEGTANGLDHIGGGSKPEVKIETPGGNKGSRYPDVSFRNPDTGEETHVNVGRTIGSGEPVARERRALEDMRRQGIQIDYVPYDR